MKILFVLDRRANAGSIQAVAHYVRTGDELGHTIALYGPRTPEFPGLRASTDVESFDCIVFIIEAGMQWMNGPQLAHVLGSVPRARRALIDTDGMFNPLVTVDGYDRNHPSEYERLRWLEYHAALADKVMQTTIEPRHPGIVALPFFGYDPQSAIAAQSSPPKQFDIVHVGHNWWRWHEASRCLLPAIERVRSQVGDICFVGSWWDGAPPWARELGLEAAFRVDRGWLERLCIRIQPAVPYTKVVSTMSRGRINIMTQRPVLRHLKMLTSKYFELFCADTIPLVMLHPDHAEAVYGPAGRELALWGGIGDKLVDALCRPARYRELVNEVRRHLVAHHSFQKRVEELVSALEG